MRQALALTHLPQALVPGAKPREISPEPPTSDDAPPIHSPRVQPVNFGETPTVGAVNFGEPQAEHAGYPLTEWALKYFIDDLLFYSIEDTSLREHTKDNSLWRLCFKVFLSQLLPLLVGAAVLQFMVGRTVLAAISVGATTWTLMSFPHVPWNFWLALAWYQILVLFAKVSFQLPLFCRNGELNIDNRCMEAASRTGWQVMSAVGLIKLEWAVADSKDFTFPLLWLLWPDLLFTCLIVLNMFAANKSGRFQDPNDILKVFDDDDGHEEMKVQREQSLGNSQGSCFLADGDDEKSDFVRLSHVSHGSDLGSSFNADLQQEIDRLTVVSDGEPQPTLWAQTKSYCMIRGQQASERLAHWAMLQFSSLTHRIVGSSRIRRPARNLYASRFGILLLCLTLVLVDWSMLSGGGSTFGEQVSSNHFSGAQALVLLMLILVSIADRALYTWYMLDQQWSESKKEGTQKERKMKDKPDENVEKTSDAGSNGSASGDEGWRDILGRPRVLSKLLQKILLASGLFFTHLILVEQWMEQVTANSQVHGSMLAQNWHLSFFYGAAMMYFAMTSMQMRYDIHIMKGGLRLTHSTALHSNGAFKVYGVIPFLHELRVLTDWTATATSMNFFMWMKLEDAHHNLHRTRIDMEFRAATKPAEQRDMCEKFYMGILLMLVLILLIIVPILAFSALSPLNQANAVTAGTLTVNLRVITASGGQRSLQLYYAPGSLTAVPEEPDLRETRLRAQFSSQSTQFERGMSLREFTFPTQSQLFWLLSDPAREEMASLTNDTENVFLDFVYSFESPENNARTAPRSMEHRTPLSLEERIALSHILHHRDSSNVTIDCVFWPLLNFDDRDIKDLIYHDEEDRFFQREREDRGEEGREECVAVKMQLSNTSGSNLPLWSIYLNDTEMRTRSTWESQSVMEDMAAQGDKWCSDEDCALKHWVVSGFVVHNVASGGGGGGGGSGWTVISMYTIIFSTIGLSVRSLFKDSSKRMPYEEMPDTELLRDLCNGIYIARIQNNLPVEYKLYHELIRIYRSPELLSHISQPKDSIRHLGVRAPQPKRSATMDFGKALGGQGVPNFRRQDSNKAGGERKNSSHQGLEKKPAGRGGLWARARAAAMEKSKETEAATSSAAAAYQAAASSSAASSGPPVQRVHSGGGLGFGAVTGGLWARARLAAQAHQAAAPQSLTQSEPLSPRRPAEESSLPVHEARSRKRTSRKRTSASDRRRTGAGSMSD